eukprot:4704831-Prymnesium_polylepis.1
MMPGGASDASAAAELLVGASACGEVDESTAINLAALRSLRQLERQYERLLNSPLPPDTHGTFAALKRKARAPLRALHTPRALHAPRAHRAHAPRTPRTPRTPRAHT